MERGKDLKFPSAVSSTFGLWLFVAALVEVWPAAKVAKARKIKEKSAFFML